MRTFVMGDIHGAYKALLQCLQRSAFNREQDCLIQLGDVADGYDDVDRCVEELLSIKHLVAIQGNHDEWFKHFIETGVHPDDWRQGGAGTRRAYSAGIPQTHKEFFRKQRLYYVDAENNCFVHGGFNPKKALADQPAENFLWDRKLWETALTNPRSIQTPFKEIFIGHTTTQSDQPMQAGNIRNLDTGAGHGGKLTIMNLHTKQFFQSDPTKALYDLFF